MKEIKSGLIAGLVFLITVCIGGIVYAATTLTAIPNEPLTAEKWNNLVSNTSRISGEIVAFDLATCPTGWSEYTPAYGRFLRGIDKSGTSIDPSGLRVNGNIQTDAIQGHKHNLMFGNGTENSTLPFDGAAGWNNVIAGSSNAGGNSIQVMNPRNDGANGIPRIANETRPKNVAVLYCRKD